jgi:hypothetical protein
MKISFYNIRLIVVASSLLASMAIQAQEVAPTPAPVQQAAPTPAPVQEAAPAPAPAQEVAPTPAPAQQAAPTPAPAQEVAPTPAPAQEAAPAPAPVQEAAPTPAPVQQAAPAPAPVQEAAPTPAPVQQAAPTPAPAQEAAPAPAPAQEVAPTPAPAQQAEQKIPGIVNASPDQEEYADEEAEEAEETESLYTPPTVKKPSVEIVEVTETINFPTKFQIEGTKILYNELEDTHAHNLDNWWGRIFFGIQSKTDKFFGYGRVAVYPENFGNNFITNVEESRDTTVYKSWKGSVLQQDSTIEGQVQYEKSAKIKLYEAFGSYNAGPVAFKVGRWMIDDKQGMTFGNYLDNSIGGKFIALGPYVEAMELSSQVTEQFFARVQLESADANLNRGNMRLFFEFANLDALNKMTFGIGYRNNIFDRIKYPDEDVIRNFDLMANLKLAPYFRLFAEGAILGVGATDENGKAEKATTVLTFGTELPLQILLDKIVLEGEFNHQRDKQFLGSIYLKKEITNHFDLEFGAYSYNQTKDFALSLRGTGYIIK